MHFPLGRQTTVALTLLFVGSFPASAGAQSYSLTIEPVTITYDVMTGEGSGTMKLFLVENLTPGVPASETAGLVIAAENDSSQFQATSIQFAGVLDFLSPGNMGLIGLETWPDGFFGKAIYDLFFMTFITFESPQLIFEVEIETNPAAWIGNLSGGTGEFTLGNPPSQNPPLLPEVSVVGPGGVVSTPVSFDFSTIHFVPAGTPFLRGDANGDGEVIPVSDAITILSGLFAGAAIACELAADVNGDGATDIADPVAMLNFGFGGGPPPPHPFPDCGVSAAPTMVPCDLSGCP